MQTLLSKIVLWFILSIQLLHAYSFEMHVDNTRPFAGEKVTLTVDFIYDNLEEYEVQEVHFDTIETTLLSDKELQEENLTHNQIIYTLKAQKAGTIQLSPLLVHIEMIPLRYQNRYNKNKYLKKFDILSNSLSLEVQPLPQSLHISGVYTMHTHIDKSSTTAGEPVTFTLSLKGEGNIKNLDFLTLEIPHTLIYENNRGLSKIFTIVPEKKFKIPSVSLDYFNLSTHAITHLQSPIYTIDVMPKSTKTVVPSWLLIVILILFGAGIIYYTFTLFNRLCFIDKRAYLLKRIKATKNNQELLKCIAPYIHKDKQIKRWILRLEETKPKAFYHIKKQIIKKITLFF